MIDKINQITLVFESAENMVIPADEIVTWRVSDVTTSLFGGRYSGNVDKYNSCKFFEITISNNFLNSIYITGYEGVNNKTTRRARLDFADIASVELEYTDGTVESCYVPWEDEAEDCNSYQCRDENTIIVCDDGDCGEYEEPIEYMEPEPETEPKVGVCDVCGRECQCNGLSFINPDRSTYQTWNVCDNCAKIIRNGIRMELTSKLTARHLPFIGNDATELNFMIKQNMIHTGTDKDYIDEMLQMYYGVDTETIIQKVREIVGE